MKLFGKSKKDKEKKEAKRLAIEEEEERKAKEREEKKAEKEKERQKQEEKQLKLQRIKDLKKKKEKLEKLKDALEEDEKSLDGAVQSLIKIKKKDERSRIKTQTNNTEDMEDSNNNNKAAEKRKKKNKWSEKHNGSDDGDSYSDDAGRSYDDDDDDVAVISDNSDDYGISGGDGGRGGGRTDNFKEGGEIDHSRWKFSERNFGGSAKYVTIGKMEEVRGKSIAKGIEKFKKHPEKYVAMTYQTDMYTSGSWEPKDQRYTLIHREGTVGYNPADGDASKSWMTLLMAEYQRCPPFEDDQLPVRYRDEYTDDMVYQNRKLHHPRKNIPIMPGRGMGVGDVPELKIIGDVDPSDINQGSVGDCWLLSGISSLAEFDGAIKHCFRKTKRLEDRPLDGPNRYTVTLWDLPTWTEVDIIIDERLPVKADGSRQLLAAGPSEDGELWVAYLEKAIACHAGGWDKIEGGQCTHAWALLTGCKHQYTFHNTNKTSAKKKKSKDRMWGCYARYNYEKKKWADHTNSPHDSDASAWPCPWPDTKARTKAGKKLMRKPKDAKVVNHFTVHENRTDEELFQAMCLWDENNYIVGAGTPGESDSNVTDGVVDNHAYSVISCFKDVGGYKGIDLIKVRNPWGKGEIEDGEFDDDGPGWDKYPKAKKICKPVVADDGIFWVTRKEFFEFFETVYLSASDMTHFLED